MTDRESLDPYVEWIVTEARRPVAVDAASRQRLMEAIRNDPIPRRQSRLLRLLLQPRRFVLPPIAAAALAAGLVGMGVLAGSSINRDGPTAVRPDQGGVASSRLPEPYRVVKFVIAAPQANSVALVGDFNDWDASKTPAVREQDGSWTMFVSLRPGRYVYSFVVDGTHFITDPAAPIAPDDGYGRNSVVVVGASS